MTRAGVGSWSSHTACATSSRYRSYGLFAEGLLELVEHLCGRADDPAVPGVAVLAVPEFVREDRDPLLRTEAGPERQADTDHRAEAPADRGEPDVRLRVDGHGCDRLRPDGLGDLVQQREQGGCLLAVDEVGVRVQPVGAGTEENRHAERDHRQRDAEPERAVEGQQGDTAEKADQGKKEDYCRQQVCPEPGGVPAGPVDAAALEFAVQGVGEPLLEPLSPGGLVGFSRRRIDVPVALVAPGDVAPVKADLLGALGAASDALLGLHRSSVAPLRAGCPLAD